MTVKELIAELQKLPKSCEDAPVGFWTLTILNKAPIFREYKTVEISALQNDDTLTVGLFL